MLLLFLFLLRLPVVLSRSLMRSRIDRRCRWLSGWFWTPDKDAFRASNYFESEMRLIMLSLLSSLSSFSFRVGIVESLVVVFTGSNREEVCECTSPLYLYVLIWSVRSWFFASLLTRFVSCVVCTSCWFKCDCFFFFCWYYYWYYCTCCHLVLLVFSYSEGNVGEVEVVFGSVSTCPSLHLFTTWTVLTIFCLPFIFCFYYSYYFDKC